jgi:ferrous iron transport protein A
MVLTLAELKVRDIAEVLTVISKGEIGKRLVDMGLRKGVVLKVLRVAPLGDPIEIEIDGFFLSLRHNEASYIHVNKLENPAGESSRHRKRKRLSRFMNRFRGLDD